MKWRLLFIALFGLSAISLTNEASAASARAELSSNQVRVGEAVKLVLTFEGGDLEITDNLDLGSLGLSVVNQATSQNYNITNGRMTSVTSYVVVLRPEREGDIVIPSLSVSIEGRALKTNPVSLKVFPAARAGSPSQGSLGSAPPQAQPANPRQQPRQQQPGQSGTGSNANQDAESQYGYIELLVPKASAYEGEMVPAELRIYINAEIRPNLQAPPEISGQGFTVQRFTNPDVSIQPINGRHYRVISFKTAISATKPGKLTIGPAKSNWTVAVPVQRRRSQRWGGGSDSLDDLLDDLSMGMGGIQYVEKTLEMKSEPVELEVKALPKEGRPADFAGAVGQFAMSTVAKPDKVDVGEPITMTSRISGTGNFDRVTAPVIEESPEWRTYPPPAPKFDPDDTVGLSGTKIFETALTANSAQRALPKATFSFFDPVAEKYVTLTSGQMAVQVVGAPAVSHAPTPAASPDAAATPGQTPAAQTAEATDILFIRPELGTVDGTFVPVWKRSFFVTTQYVAGSTLFLTILAFALAARSRNQARKQAAALARELSGTMAKLKKSDATMGDFYSDAVHYLSVAANEAGASGHPDSAEEVLAVRPVGDEIRAEIEAVFVNRDALRYGRAGDAKVDEGVRARVISALEAYHKAPRMSGGNRAASGVGLVAALFLGAMVLANPQGAHAQTPEERFELANKAYEAGKFQDAVTDYEYLAQSGVKSPNLYFNLGDAWYRLNETGKAILNYERALALDPSHPEALANLRLARKMVDAPVGELPWWLVGIEAVGVNRLPWLISGALWLGAFLLVFAIFRLGGRRGLWVTFGALSWMAAVVFAAGIWIYAEQNGISDAGVVVAPKVKGRVAPVDSAEQNVEVPLGARVRMLSDRGSWIYVEMPNGDRGWVPEGAVEAIRPKPEKPAGA